LSEIARALGRNKGTVSRELSRNKVRRKGRLRQKKIYDSLAAHRKAQARRNNAKYVGMQVWELPELKDYVVEGLKRGWAPQTISGRMKAEGKPFYASKNAIYAFLYSPYGQRYCKYLKSHRYNKRKRGPKKTKKSLIPNRISIHERPAIIDNKLEYGHFEGDTIHSGKNTGSKVALSTIYELKAMYIDARKIPNLSPKENIKALERMFAKLKNSRSLTLDNGLENTLHEQLQKKFTIQTYFCDPHSSWQKPGIENANKLIRRFIPKGSDIGLYSRAFIRKKIKELNDTPRKALGYKTPNEVMMEHKLFKNKKI